MCPMNLMGLNNDKEMLMVLQGVSCEELACFVSGFKTGVTDQAEERMNL